jgi:hypothetical protein
MKYSELTELFDRVVEYTVHQTEDVFKAEFTVGGRLIRWEAVEEMKYDVNHNPDPEWDISFCEVDGNESNYELTNGGNEFQIMGTIRAIMQEFFQTINPQAVKFSADNGDTSRASLYTKMASKFIPKSYQGSKARNMINTKFRFKKI